MVLRFAWKKYSAFRLVLLNVVGIEVEVVTDLHRSIWKRLKGIPLKERVPDRFDGIKIELSGKMSTDGIGVGRVVGGLADVIDRGLPAPAPARPRTAFPS